MTFPSCRPITGRQPYVEGEGLSKNAEVWYPTCAYDFCTEMLPISVQAALRIILQYTRMTGTIKRLTDKGFGFIAVEGAAKDIFFHSDALVGVTFDELKVDEQVTFETEESEKGPRARNVQRA